MTFSDWPWQYCFPPFFTIQPNLETRDKQLSAWCDLVLKYCKANNKYIIDVREAESWPLFNNQEIQRNLSSDGIQLVLNNLQNLKNAEPLDKSKSRWYIFWHTVDEWAATIYAWANRNGFTNTVCTLYEIINTPDEEFNGMDEEVLLKILSHLEKNNTAEIISMDDSKGVKFF